MEKSEIGSFAMKMQDGDLQNRYWSSISLCALNFAIRDASGGTPFYELKFTDLCLKPFSIICRLHAQ